MQGTISSYLFLISLISHFYRILKDFYFQPGLTSRPKLFGMTASPVDAKVGVFKAARLVKTL